MMMRSTLLVLGLSLGMGGVFAQDKGDRGTGFLDLNRVFQEDARTKVGLEKAREERVKKRKELDDRAKRLGELRLEQEKYAAGSQDFFRLQAEVERLNATLEIESKIIGLEYDLAVVKLVREAYARSQAVTEKVAKERSFSSIAIYTTGELSGQTYREAVGDILTRTFIWMDKSRDITADVLAAMRE